MRTDSMRIVIAAATFAVTAFVVATLAADSATADSGDAAPAAAPAGDEEVLATMVPEGRLVRALPWSIDEEDGWELAAASDGSWNDFAYYEGMGQDPRLKQDVDVSWVVAWGRSGDARVRVALATAAGNKVLAARVLAVEPADAAEPEAFARFLDQFVGRFGMTTTADSWNPVDRLHEQLEAAAKAETDEGKRLAFLVRQVEMMRHNQELSSRLFPDIQKKSKEAAVAAKGIAHAFEELQGREADVAIFLGADAAKQYVAKAADMQRTMDRLASEVEDEDWDGAIEVMRVELQRGCGACHGWDEHPLGGTLQNAFGVLRNQHDIGPGYFVLGHDLVADPSLSEDLQQAAGFAVKKALLFPSLADTGEDAG